MPMLATLTKNPLRNMRDLRSEIDKVFEDAFSAMNLKNYRSEEEGKLEYVVNWYPHVDTYELEDKFVVKAALPGVEKDQINIEVEDNRLTFSGENKYQNEVNEENLYRSEIAYGCFRRSFSLGKEIDVEKVNADFKNGLLTIELPKKEPEKAKTKKIELK